MTYHPPSGLLQHRAEGTTVEPRTLTQYAPWPHELEEVIAGLTNKPPEMTRIFIADMVRDEEYQGRGAAGGLTLEIRVESPDSYSAQPRRVRHLFIVPAATYNKQAWTRWLHDRMADVRMHELGEYYEIDGVKPFPPLHGPGDNPYIVHDWSTDLQRRTAYTGEVKQ